MSRLKFIHLANTHTQWFLGFMTSIEPTHTGKKVIVGMSGGVDSSVSAYLLMQQGYQVEGLFMKNWEEDDNNEYCAAAEDLKDAQAVCDKLGIKLHTVNFAAEYWDKIGRASCRERV